MSVFHTQLCLSVKDGFEFQAEGIGQFHDLMRIFETLHYVSGMANTHHIGFVFHGGIQGILAHHPDRVKAVEIQPDPSCEKENGVGKSKWRYTR